MARQNSRVFILIFLGMLTAQCRKGAQCPFGKDVLAKRQTNAVAFVKRQTAM